jgi:pyruvate,water dikinase
MNYIRWFHEIGSAELGHVGGKGANLGELTRAGLPVPPGFCVASSAYQDFLKETGLDQLIEKILTEIDLDDREDVAGKSAQVRDLIISHPILPEIADQVLDGYHRLLNENRDLLRAEVSLAIRSSATAEDQANASFAGQLETYLNVRGETSLLDHVRLCWASLWSDRVVSYIARQGLDHRLVSMSVVVQMMIPAEVSGVMFTANPVTRDNREIVLNASWGLGEAIVSGVVTPDTITVRKSDAHILSRQTSTKELMVAYAAGGGTEEIPVPENRRSIPVLSDHQVKALAELGKRIETYYGKPQDIEWGYCREQWFLLQSRPITTLSQQPEMKAPEGNFNRTMFIDIFPDPLSPVFLSVIEHLFRDMLDFTFKALGFKPSQDIQAIGVFYNQPYFNRDYIAAAFQPLSPAVREPLIAQIVNPFGHEQETANVELSVPYLRMASRILRFMVRFPKRLPGLLASYHAEIAKAESFPYESASDAEIVALIHRLPFEHASKLLNYDFLMIAVIGRTYRLLGAFLKRYYGGDTDEVVARLISGVTGNVTMETNKRLWDLAQLARSSPAVSAVLREQDYPQVRSILEQTSEGRTFLASLDEFLAEFGHREVRMDILDPTWRDDPQPVFSFIRSYQDADEAQSPHRQQERLIKERQQMTGFVVNDIQKSLFGRLVLAPMFKWILKQTQVYTRERDTMHFEMTRIFPPLRRMFLELGQRWTGRGLMDRAEDIFFLTLEEIQEIAGTPRPVHDVVASRRQKFYNNQRRPWPNVIHNGAEIYAEEAEAGEIQASVLQGVPGSPGTASGLSRVIQKPEEFSKLKKGEILVAPFTNPVWTPLFAVAGGVVTEVGGILSHGAIVAREYGIPAVMSVSGATKRLRDGQYVTLDGNKGMIFLDTGG